MDPANDQDPLTRPDLTENQRLRRVAQVLFADQPTGQDPSIDTHLGLSTIRTGLVIWQVERITGSGSFQPGAGYRIYAARPGQPDSVTVRGLAQLDDGTTYALDDRAGVSAFASTGAGDPLVIGYLAARYADAQDYPRRVLQTGDLAPKVISDLPGETVVLLHTARIDYTPDELEFDRIERWRVVTRPDATSWSIEVGGL